MLCYPQGFFKVLGKGVLPKRPLIVRARFFSKTVRVPATCRRLCSASCAMRPALADMLCVLRTPLW